MVVFDKNQGFPIEESFVHQFGGKLVTDLDRQFKDIDSEMDYKGKDFTFSIKHQKTAERTGNFSFEVVLEDTRTGEQRIGNFHENESDYYVINANSKWYIWESHKLHKYIMDNKARYKYIHTSDYLELDNRNKGRKYDRGYSYLVPIKELIDLTNKIIDQE